MPFSATFLTINCPPDASTAARSHTESTPVVSFTNAEAVKSPGTARSSSGHPIPTGTLVKVDKIEGVKVFVTEVPVTESVV